MRPARFTQDEKGRWLDTQTGDFVREQPKGNRKVGRIVRGGLLIDSEDTLADILARLPHGAPEYAHERRARRREAEQWFARILAADH